MHPFEHSVVLLSFVKLPFVFKTFDLSIFERPLKTGFTVIKSPKRSFLRFLLFLLLLFLHFFFFFPPKFCLAMILVTTVWIVLKFGDMVDIAAKVLQQMTIVVNDRKRDKMIISLAL